ARSGPTDWASISTLVRFSCWAVVQYLTLSFPRTRTGCPTLTLAATLVARVRNEFTVNQLACPSAQSPVRPSNHRAVDATRNEQTGVPSGSVLRSGMVATKPRIVR